MREATEPIYDVIDWLRHDPDVHEVVGAADAEAARVFYPTQQDPSSDFPYVRYATSTVSLYPWLRQDHITMALFVSSIVDSGQLMNIIMDKVQAGDESAAHLNKFLRETAEYPSPFTYKSMEWVDGGHTEPTAERGGAHARLVTFRYTYTVPRGMGISRRTVGA